MQSSLERLLVAGQPRDTINQLESWGLRQFQSKFHLYDQENSPPDSKLAWLSAMQHYGVPTRLLDFTQSPYIALYFALESHNPSAHGDMAVYAMDCSALMKCSVDEISKHNPALRGKSLEQVDDDKDNIFDKIIDTSSFDILWVTEPKILNVRVDRQAGTFLIAGNRLKTTEELLMTPTYQHVAAIKYEIPKEFYSSIFAMLRKVNITSKTLYGGLYGLGGSVRMELRVYSS